MNLAVLQMIADELNLELSGGFINKIHQPLPRQIVLTIRGKFPGAKKLVISADPQLGRVHLTESQTPNPTVPPRFCAYLRAHLQGARISHVQAADNDRVVFIHATRGPEFDRMELALILELLGRDSNIILVNKKTEMIMDLLHHISEKESVTRAMLTGKSYTPPPRNPNTKVSPAQNNLSVRPGICEINGKMRLVISADQNCHQVFESMNAAAEAFYHPRVSTELFELRKRNISAPIINKIKSLERRLTKIRADAERLTRFVELQDHGELLKANLFGIKKGMTEVNVTDWSGNPVVLRLDPSLDPVANMNLIFKKAAKGKRGKKFVEDRLEMTTAEKIALEEQLFYVLSASTLDESDLTPNMSAQPNGQRQIWETAPKSLPYRFLKTPSGSSVYVGKSSKGNDYILRHKASKDDLWFHVKGKPGSHVILRVTGAKPTDQDIEFCAGLAVEFSRAKGKGKTEVMLTRVKNVGKAKGALPGQVTVKNYNTVLSGGGIALETNR